VGLGFEGVNSRVTKWLLDQFGEDDSATSTPEKTSAVLADPRLRGWAMIDFYSDPDQMLLALLVECNYHGRKAGEEGWPSAGYRIFNMFR
jgi:1-phosphatidylinositol phosphodiesterase